MERTGRSKVDVSDMPRGGPTASCLDRFLETDRLEYLDREDVDPGVRRSVVRALELTGEWFGNHEKFAHIVLDEVAEVPDPRILELGAGHGGLSAKLVEMHPTARVTVTDVEPDSVSAIAAGPLGSDGRVTVCEADATEMTFDDGTFDLAVFALSFHHLPPALAARVIAEGTRVADKLVIIDLPRPPAPLHLIRLATMLPLAPFHPVRPRRGHQFTAQLQPLGVAHPRRRRSGRHHGTQRRTSECAGRGGLARPWLESLRRNRFP